VSVAADIGEPLVFDAKFGEGALDDEGVGAVVDTVDFAGDAVGERGERGGGMAQQAVAAQRGEEVLRDGIERVLRDDALGLLKVWIGNGGAAKEVAEEGLD
jgi:hypothetical protein